MKASQAHKKTTIVIEQGSRVNEAIRQGINDGYFDVELRNISSRQLKSLEFFGYKVTALGYNWFKISWEHAGVNK